MSGSSRSGGVWVWVVVPLLIGCAGGQEDPEWRTVFGYPEQAVTRIEIRDFGFPFVPVEIAGDTVWAAFDTGNTVGLILQSEVFDELGLPCSDRWPSYDSGGNLISSGCVAHGVETSVFGARQDSVAIYEFFNEDLPGLVGPGSLPGTRFTLDYHRELMAVGGGDEIKEVPGFVALPLIRSSRHPRLILVYGSLGERKVLIEIDTGKSRTTIDRSLVEELDLGRSSSGVTVGEVRLGPRTLSISSAKVVSTSGISGGLPMPISLGIGSDKLADFLFTVDFEWDQLWIEQP